MGKDSDGTGSLGSTSVKLKSALTVLSEASHYATDTGSNIWDFAISIRHLRALGLSETDLRWLVRKGYVLHGREVTLPGQNGREFRPTGDLTFGKRTCFVLSETGISAAHSIARAGPSRLENAVAAPERAGLSAEQISPRWDPEIRELRINGHLVKRFKWHAVNQEIVLTAFQEDGWPARIDDPLPPHGDLAPKRRLSDTIRCLNRKQQNELIRFRGDGTGEGVAWEYTPSK